jgi:hypothetical protein
MGYEIAWLFIYMKPVSTDTLIVKNVFFRCIFKFLVCCLSIVLMLMVRTAWHLYFKVR